MSRRYYIAEGETAERLAELYARLEEAQLAVNALKDEFGADAVSLIQNTFGTVVHGFRFDDESKPDKQLLRKGKHGPFVPNYRTKEGRALKSRIEAISIPSGADVANIIGLQTIDPKSMTVVTPGLTKVGNQYLITARDSNGEPRGCRRVSDLDAEALIEKYDADRKPPRRKPRKSPAKRRDS